MKIERMRVFETGRSKGVKKWLESKGGRLGLITSVNGEQLISLMLDTEHNLAECWETELEHDSTSYSSLTPLIPQCHWFERTVWDLFGLHPDGHPRLKHNLLHESYDPDFLPLSSVGTDQHLSGHHKPLKSGFNPSGDENNRRDHRSFHPLEVHGEAIYEIPVGPIHAGIIEPGHFRFSCLGEIIENLELHLGYVHRGVEKRLTETPWRKGRFVVEAAASDSAAAYALAHAIAIESLFNITAPPRAQYLRYIALEIERIAMHVSDIGGVAGDIGFLAISSSMSRLRGDALRLAELLTGSRFQRAFICPGGVIVDRSENFDKIREHAITLKKQLQAVTDLFIGNPVAQERMQGVGRISPALARDFGFVGIAARACGIDYDCRKHFDYGNVYADLKVAIVPDGDVYARTLVRLQELQESFRIIDRLFQNIPSGSICVNLPEQLPADKVGLGLVEAHRGELIHLIFTNKKGEIERYAIKDASVNNWTALAIAARNNLVADFPLCNKSLSLSYSGHDL